MSSASEQSSTNSPNAAGFATTHWSLVLAAGRGVSAASSDALAVLCRTYWYPLYAFARRRGSNANDAKDLTQSFFAHLLEKESLQAADPDRGRFRSFLLTSFKNFLSKERARCETQKRGGGLKHLSIDFDFGERRYQFEPIDDWTPEKIYERRWALTLLDEVLHALQREYEVDGKSEFFELCKGHLTGVGPGYCEAAEQLSTTEGNLRVAVHRMRSRYRDMLKSAVASTLESEDAADDELGFLRRAIRGEA